MALVRANLQGGRKPAMTQWQKGGMKSYRPFTNLILFVCDPKPNAELPFLTLKLQVGQVMYEGLC